MRWKCWFDYQYQKLEGNNPEEPDFYVLEEPWTKDTSFYPAKSEGDCISTVKRIFAKVFE